MSAIIEIRNRKGLPFKNAIIDEEDLPLVSGRKWFETYAGYVATEKKPEGRLLLHKLIMGVEKNSKLLVDHINGNTFDCRKSNLRVCGRVVNGQNRTKLDSNNTSGFRGVSFDKSRNKWKAYAKKDSKQVLVGRYDTVEEAALAAKDMRNKLAYATGAFE